MTLPFQPKLIPYEGPDNAKIIFVGESPGADEHLEGRPFIGESGRILMDCLGRHGLSRSDVKLCNLFMHKPDSNKLALVLKTAEFTSNLSTLYEYIDSHKPNLIVPLGAFPLQFLTGRKGIMKWRGSIISYIHDPSIKVIPTIHPAAVLREHKYYPTFDNDIRRIAGDTAFPEKNLPQRKFIIDPRGLDCEEWIQRLSSSKFLGTDIETIKNSQQILCVGFSPEPGLAVCFIVTHAEGRRAVERVLMSDADKIFQFGTFDTIQLKLNGYQINSGNLARSNSRPYYWDTMVAQHILVPELPRSLEYLTSVHTREPYYKTVGRGTIPDDEKGWSDKIEKQSLYEYNCRDCCCTIEVALQQMKDIESAGLSDMFQFEMEMLEVTDHISMSGMAIDNDRRLLLEKALLTKWKKKQYLLNLLTRVDCNVRSPKLKSVLYDNYNLPVKKNRDGGITTDEDAIVSLITHCKDHIAKLKTESAINEWKEKLAVCQTILEIRGLRVVLSNFILATFKKGKMQRAGKDGRIRSTYKQAADTGRWTCSGFVDGSGFNAQTLPRDPVDIPDEVLEEQTKLALVDQLNEEDEGDNEEEKEKE